MLRGLLLTQLKRCVVSVTTPHRLFCCRIAHAVAYLDIRFVALGRVHTGVATKSSKSIFSPVCTRPHIDSVSGFAASVYRPQMTLKDGSNKFSSVLAVLFPNAACMCNMSSIRQSESIIQLVHFYQRNAMLARVFARVKSKNLAQLYKMEKEDDELIFACSTIIFASVGIAASAIARHTRTHSVWVKEYIRDRERFGAYHTLIPQLADTDTARCVQYLRIDICTFEELLQLVEPYITRTVTKFKFFVHL